ncbi:hypothetical protein [Amycolatopsis jejuensis]|uniref:hypothetical protein n=1 Tax=Amycolatopsis jejuensis TaxID=330084 RepID=UPI0005259307|nr:hypothetical protein [Amycolatopsis jejuensis]
MKKLVTTAFLALGILAATATNASAANWYYTGHYYGSEGACHQGWIDIHGGGGAAQPHQCRNHNGSWELWEYR